MRIVIEKNNKNILHAAFVIWLISEIIFAHTPIAQAALLLFTGFAILVVPMIHGLWLDDPLVCDEYFHRPCG